MNFKKILLVNSNYPNSAYSIPVWPLGLGYIAETLKHRGIEYEVIDLGFSHNLKNINKRISDFHPDLIGISFMSSKYKHHYETIGNIKKSFPHIPIAAGGPHVSTLREKVLMDCPELDYGISGEGEETIIELCEGAEHKEIRGLYYRSGAEVKYEGDRTRIADLDNIPFPTYEGFEIEKYDTKSMNILSSRGCPYDCIYCSVKLAIGRKWKARTAINVVDEITYWYELGYRFFNFNDDAFNVNTKRVYDICDEIEKRNLKIEINAPNGMRADKADLDLLKRMKEIGFRHIALGVESADNRVLENIKKGECIEEIEETIKNACNLGFEVALFFLIGSPGEGEKEIEESFKLAKKYPIVDVRFYNLVPFPNTELFEWIDRNNYFIQRPADYLNGNMQWLNEPIFFTPELSIEARKNTYKRGLKIGKKLRRQYTFNYYNKCFKKLGIFSTLFAFMASRDFMQFVLSKSNALKKVRILFKKYEIFRRV